MGLKGQVTNGTVVGRIINIKSSPGGTVYVVKWENGFLGNYHIDDIKGYGNKCFNCFTFGDYLLESCVSCGSLFCKKHILKKRGKFLCGKCSNGSVRKPKEHSFNAEFPQPSEEDEPEELEPMVEVSRPITRRIGQERINLDQQGPPRAERSTIDGNIEFNTETPVWTPDSLTLPTSEAEADEEVE